MNLEMMRDQNKKQNISLKMEELNQEISAWHDEEFQILDSTYLKKHSKKRTQVIIPQPKLQKIQRKLKQSHTLPIIKNIRQSLAQDITNSQQIKQDCNDYNVKKKSDKNFAKTEILSQIEDQIKEKNSNFITTQNVDIPKQNEDIIPQIRQLLKTKNSAIVIKQTQLSNIQKLKIQASEYCSTPKHLSLQNKQRSKQLLLKINQNFSKDFTKKSKSKYFIVQKQKISPQKTSQAISKIAIQSRKSYDEAQISHYQKANTILEQKFKNIGKDIECDRKNSCSIFKSKSQQLSTFLRHKKNMKNQLKYQEGNSKNLTIDYINERNQDKINSKRYMKNDSALRTNDFSKSKKATKLNQILQHSQQLSKYLKKTQQMSIKMLRLSSQVQQINLMDEIMLKKAQNLKLILANKQKSNPFDKQIHKTGNKRRITNATNQPQVLDEFNDEYIFVQK